MLKIPYPVNEPELEARDALLALLAQVPAIDVLHVTREPKKSSYEVDLIATIEMDGKRRDLVCEVNGSGQPRYVRTALLQLRNYVVHRDVKATPVFIAPYLSPQAQQLCREADVAYLDLVGNARIVFDGVFIERQVDHKPSVVRRELRSLFKPKSAQVLRVMFREPMRPWRVTDLADAANVSLGHISNVKLGLIDREWASTGPNGFFLSEPDALLDAWRDVYELPGKWQGYYTTFHGKGLEAVVKTAMGNHNVGLAFASFSAANWLAPFARTGSHYFYADKAGLDLLRTSLGLSSIVRGENVSVMLLDDTDLLRDTVEAAPDVICTNYVQTYLDLTNAGERGLEAAEYLRQEKLKWPK